MEFKKGDKVVVKPWGEAEEAKPATIVETERAGRMVQVDFGKGRYQWIAVIRLEVAP